MQNGFIQLKNELEQELHQNILNYWMLQALDTTNGGFIGAIDAQNQPNPKAPKGSVLNARILWTFSAAYRLTQKPEYLEMAHRSCAYNTEHFLDKTYGGVYWELDFQGNPLNPRKQIYALSFMIYGLTEYFRITNDKTALSAAIDLFDSIEKYSFDKERNGYIEALSENWQKLDDLRLSEKVANESKTMNTHLHILEAYTNLFRIYKSQKLYKALKNLIELFLEKFISPSYHLNLFFDDDWNLKGDHISFGHDIECSWLLFEAAEVLGDTSLIEKVKPVTIQMANAVFEGIDTDGGLFNELEPAHQKLDTDKHWWPQAEGLVGYYNAYRLSGDDSFSKQTFKSWEFIKNHLIDRRHGEWFWRVNKNGIPNFNDEKAGFWKCPYHNSRACLEIMKRLYHENK